MEGVVDHLVDVSWGVADVSEVRLLRRGTSWSHTPREARHQVVTVPTTAIRGPLAEKPAAWSSACRAASMSCGRDPHAVSRR